MDVIVDDQPAVRAAALIAAQLATSIRQRGKAEAALSGGSTAPAMIEALIATPELDWSAITVWQVDERIAPDGDPARNANQLSLLPCRVRLMPVTSTDRRAAARRYAATLPERFDSVHLGLGSDGHTASWPPAEPQVATSFRSVELVSQFSGFDRMTLTESVVNAARQRVVFVVGEAKRSIVQRWLGGDRSLPIAWVRQTGTTLVGDRSAVGGVDE